MLEALTHESVAVDLVDVAVAQVQCHNVVVRVAQRPEDFDERIVAQVQRRQDRRLVLEARSGDDLRRRRLSLWLLRELSL